MWCERHQHRSCARICVDQFPALCDLPKNIVFFVNRECINELPTALITYDKTKEACGIKNKLKSVQDTLSNRFDSLASIYSRTLPWG